MTDSEFGDYADAAGQQNVTKDNLLESFLNAIGNNDDRTRQQRINEMVRQAMMYNDRLPPSYHLTQKQLKVLANALIDNAVSQIDLAVFSYAGLDTVDIMGKAMLAGCLMSPGATTEDFNLFLLKHLDFVSRVRTADRLTHIDLRLSETHMKHVVRRTMEQYTVYGADLTDDQKGTHGEEIGKWVVFACSALTDIFLQAMREKTSEVSTELARRSASGGGAQKRGGAAGQDPPSKVPATDVGKALRPFGGSSCCVGWLCIEARPRPAKCSFPGCHHAHKVPETKQKAAKYRELFPQLVQSWTDWESEYDAEGKAK